MLELHCEAEVIHWRGPAPFFFAELPPQTCTEIAKVARSASYGWGVIPVEAQIDGFTFTTSLIPRHGGYLMPLKVAVRKQLASPDATRLSIHMTIVSGSEAKT
jgi:hypothetical protein